MGCSSSKIAPNPGYEATTEPSIPTSRREKVLRSINADIDRQLGRQDSAKAMRGLFLGTGESGKSTVFKQMRLLYGQSFDNFERFQYSKIIWVDTLRAMRAIVDEIDARHLSDPNGHDTALQTHAQILQALNLSQRILLDMETDADARRFLGNFIFQTPQYQDKNVETLLYEGATEFAPTKAMPDNTLADREVIANAIRDLWTRSTLVREVFEHPKNLSLDTNIDYFFDNVERMRHVSYLASDEDILRARIKTTGITETTFFIKKAPLCIVDVGGQRTERKKWIQNFEDVTCILYVAAVSEYDQTLVEDSRVNRLEESLEVFRQTVESPFFANKPVALFLNKIDVLEAKLKRVPFQEYYPNYTGDPLSSKDVIDYIEGEYRKRLKGKTTALYTYRTCATDRAMMKFVVDAVTDMIFMENIKWAGLL